MRRSSAAAPTQAQTRETGRADLRGRQDVLPALATRSPPIPSDRGPLHHLNKTCYNGLYRVNSQGKFNVPSDVEALIEQLRLHKRKHEKRAGQTYEDGKTYYRRVRDAEPSDPVEIAARFIYLNKTCYNGLYRVNSQGKFNVPEGRYKNPDICNADRLRETSQALENAIIRVGDFASVVQPGRDDLVYCDPPYDGVFTGYQASGFGENDQERLRNAANAWTRSGARVVLSNADTPAMRKLYSDFRIHEATAPRPINSKGTGRRNAAELIITSE